MKNNKNSDWVQMPVRLDRGLASKLASVSNATKIPKSEIIRSSVRKFLIGIDETRICTDLNAMHNL